MSAPASTVTFELRTPRTDEHDASAMVAFLSTLPTPPRNILHSFKKAPTFTLEFLSQGQTIYTLLTLPAGMATYVTSQLSSAYPEVLINQLSHNPLDEFQKPGVTITGELSPSALTCFPLRTYKESTTADPLANVLSVLSKLQEGESALLQLSVRRTKENWKSAFRHRPTNAETPANPHQSLIDGKLALPSFQYRLRVLILAQTKEKAVQLRQELATAYGSFDTQVNSLVLKKPLFAKKTTHEVVCREGKFARQFLSIDELATLMHFPNKQLSAIKNIAWGKNLLGEPPANLPAYSTISEDERINVNFFAQAEFKNQNQVFGIKRADRRRHMYVIGKSGTGKSTMLANMIIHDLKHGEGIAVIDPHGDLIETVLNYIPKGRINDVIVFDPADPHAVVKMNLFEGGSLVHRELIASGIVSIFQKMYGPVSWGPRLEYILRNTLLTLLSEHAKLEDILRMLTDVKFRARVIENLQDPVLKNFWVAEFNTMQDRQRNEAIAPILNKVGQFVTSPLIRNVVNTQTSSFNIEEVMDQGKILLVNVSQGKLGEDNASLLGALMITKIQLAAMNRVYMDEEKRRDFYLYIDEFQNFATTSFVKILSEARKYRLNLILANQYMDQIPDDVKAAIFGNAGSIISFILGAGDAEWMKKEFGNKYSDEDLVSLARYQVVTKLMIDNQMSLPFPAQTLSLAKSSNQNRDKVLRVSRERYAKKT
ncbi:hypothetical protein C5B42_03200 [Candidatus Cerribacteria bacterium 'Amazon FNV 2010 28 9']|uniref:Type IV secretion system coupling protein TraD DNA-binding domain-containing protein n=1 Tax=Candidatus Cerribacteria bacterium 'Amazon FNV 2010 28 9' TaxID=2081795 RepID=A0A317JQ40_9BACT|nr:MAG: hypothetical protein C5B42_03200 [Candidatus Cerribacteria bacterium 'Amazon FNV 2010 28 9']